MITSKSSKSLVKKDLVTDKSPAIAVKKVLFYHEATLGDTSINLLNLKTPTSAANNGYIAPSPSEFTAMNLQTNFKNLTLFSVTNGVLSPLIQYTLTGTTVVLATPAASGEVFFGIIDPVIRSDSLVADVDFILANGILPAGQLDMTVGKSFKVNMNPNNQTGAVQLEFDGVVQRRNPSNGLTGGDYYELPDSGGAYSSMLRATTASGVDRKYRIISTACSIIRPDGSSLDEMERMQGTIDKIVEICAAEFGISETNFQAAPSSIQLSQFGDRMLELERGGGSSTKVVLSLTNNTGSTIVAGKVVYITTTANEIAIADADLLSTSKSTVGVTVDNINDGSTGYVQIAGRAVVSGTYTPGTETYLSTTAGAATSTPPAIGKAMVKLGIALSATEIDIDAEFIDIVDNSYDETITLVASSPGSYELIGPITSGNNITLPLYSRNGGAARSYTVGEGALQLYLNGVKLRLGDDWLEVGTFGNLSTAIQTGIDLAVGDFLTFSIQLKGVTVVSGGGGGGEVNTGSSLGAGAAVFKQKSGVDLQFRSLTATSGILVTQNTNTISLAARMTTRILAANGPVLDTDDVILVNASSGAVTAGLPPASSVPGKVYVFKKIDVTGNSMDIAGDMSDTIDGNSTITTGIQYEAFTIVSDGSNWHII
jgi:hypothetical protein